MTRAGFGDYQLSKPGNKTKKVEKGNNYLRILPPMHSLIGDKLGWRVYKTTIWGFNGVGTEPGKTKARPVQTCEVRKGKMIIQEDPAVEWINKHLAETEQYEALFLKEKMDAGMSEKDANKALEADENYKQRKDWEKVHNIERRWYVNAMYKDATFGPFKMNHRDDKAGIDELNKELEKEGVDPFDLDAGVWYNIKRSEQNTTPPTPDKVDFEWNEQEVDFNGQKMKAKIRVKAPLSIEQSNQALNECPDLSTLGGQVVTPEQMQQLVDCVENGGDPEEIDRILDSNASTVKSETKVEKTLVKSETKSEAVDPAIATRLAEIQARKKAEAEVIAKALAEAPLPVVKEPEDIKKMSDDEFLAKFGG